MSTCLTCSIAEPFIVRNRNDGEVYLLSRNMQLGFSGGEFAIQQTPRFGIHNLRRIGGLVTAVFLASAKISDSFSSQVL